MGIGTKIKTFLDDVGEFFLKFLPAGEAALTAVATAFPQVSGAVTLIEDIANTVATNIVNAQTAYAANPGMTNEQQATMAVTLSVNGILSAVEAAGKTISPANLAKITTLTTNANNALVAIFNAIDSTEAPATPPTA